MKDKVANTVSTDHTFLKIRESRNHHHHYHNHQNDSCIEMGSDESRFNVSLIVKDKVANTVSTDNAFSKIKENRKTTTTSRMTPALRWPAMRTVSMFC